MFGGLTKTSSRIAIAAALGLTLGGFAMKATPVKAADLGGDCCADLEERVAELEATTVRKGNKKVSVTLSGWVVKLGTWWDDGKTTGFYVGDKDTTLSSHFTISGQATIAPGWHAGYNLTVEAPGDAASAGFTANQFNNNSWNFSPASISTLLSYMWVKSDKYGTLNWGQLSQATDNVALLPDLSGTIIESNAVLFDGAGMFVRPKSATNSNDMIQTSAASPGDFKWLNVVTCLDGGGGVGADCNGYPENGVRYDSPTFGGFSMSGGYYENYVWDVTLKYAADWNSIKFSAAVGFDKNTDPGCTAQNTSLGENVVVTGSGCSNATNAGGGGAPGQSYRKEVDTWQVGASVMHKPSGLFVYGLYQNEDNQGTQWLSPDPFWGDERSINSKANNTDVWFVKAGIKRNWSPLGATALFGEGGQYLHQFTGMCGSIVANPFCEVELHTAGNFNQEQQDLFVLDSTVNRWGLGVVQEIDSAAMHVFARWQHLEVNLDLVDETEEQAQVKANRPFDSLDLFQVGGVMFF